MPFITGGGAVLVFLGLAGLFFGSAISLAPSVAAGMLLVGAFLIGYDGLFAPLLDKGAAAREFDEKPELGMAGTYRFTPDGVEIRNGRIEGTLPRAQVTSAAETQSLFSIAFGREVRILIPKRLLGEDVYKRQPINSRTLPPRRWPANRPVIIILYLYMEAPASAKLTFCMPSAMRSNGTIPPCGSYIPRVRS